MEAYLINKKNIYTNTLDPLKRWIKSMVQSMVLHLAYSVNTRLCVIATHNHIKICAVSASPIFVKTAPFTRFGQIYPLSFLIRSTKLEEII